MDKAAFNEALIMEVEKRHVLWDLRDRDYKNNIKRDQAWRAIAAALGVDEQAATSKIWNSSTEMALHVQKLTVLVSITLKTIWMLPVFILPLHRKAGSAAASPPADSTLSRSAKRKRGQDKAFEKEISILGEMASKKADASELFGLFIGDKHRRCPQHLRGQFEMELLQVAARYVDNE
ncbi:hypothetical protein MTO96_024801 [Rhipicephalus appendiculatus]